MAGLRLILGFAISTTGRGRPHEEQGAVRCSHQPPPLPLTGSARSLEQRPVHARFEPCSSPPDYFILVVCWFCAVYDTCGVVTNARTCAVSRRCASHLRQVMAWTYGDLITQHYKAEACSQDNTYVRSLYVSIVGARPAMDEAVTAWVLLQPVVEVCPAELCCSKQ
nr:hypothetical protein CFP56_24627 [Quercus suber]